MLKLSALINENQSLNINALKIEYKIALPYPYNTSGVLVFNKKFHIKNKHCHNENKISKTLFQFIAINKIT